MRKITFPQNVPDFKVRVTLAEDVYSFRFRWNAWASRWAFDAYDNSGNSLWKGIFASTGVLYGRLFPGKIPDDSEFFFFGDETDSTFSNFFMAVND